MKPETAKMLKELEYEMFESEEHASIRAMFSDAPRNDGKLEDIDVVLDRIDNMAPALIEFVNTLINIPTAK